MFHVEHPCRNLILIKPVKYTGFIVFLSNANHFTRPCSYPMCLLLIVLDGYLEW